MSSAQAHRALASNHEEGVPTESVESVLRYASYRFSAAGVDFRPSKMSRIIRRAARTFDGGARAAVDTYLNLVVDQALRSHLWSGFELYVASGYADPTGAAAAHHLDATGAAKHIRGRRDGVMSR